MELTDNNSYVDDFYGHDVADNDNNPNPPNTNLDHGTHSWNFWSSNQ